MRAEILSIGCIARASRRYSPEELELSSFTKALAVMKALDSPVVSENKASVAEWFADGKLSAGEREAIYKAMRWEMPG